MLTFSSSKIFYCIHIFKTEKAKKYLINAVNTKIQLSLYTKSLTCYNIDISTVCCLHVHMIYLVTAHRMP